MAVQRGLGVLALMMILSGCTSYWRVDGDSFDHANVPTARFVRDNSDCQATAVEQENETDDNNFLYVYNVLYTRCMKARGYRKVAQMRPDIF